MTVSTNRPNTFIVGAPKCGTTAWVSYLSDHKDIFFTPVKEPHYFSEDFPRFRWAKSVEDYEALFENAQTASVIGEASVQYLYSKCAARNIYAYAPDARILIFLRPQATFLPSYHHQLVYNRDETIESFSDAWRSSGKRTVAEMPSTCREPAFLEYSQVGAFSQQVKRYLDLFPRNQIKVIFYDQWTNAPGQAYRDILQFLGVDDDGRTEFSCVHGAKHNRLNMLSNLTQRPPAWLLSMARALKAITGREKLGAANVIRGLNTKIGYKEKIPDGIRDEITAYFCDDNEKLKQLLAK